jgi:hypothetical protein
MYGDLQSAMEATVSKAQARREIEKHNASWAEFVAECGEYESYSGADVLGWLGY